MGLEIIQFFIDLLQDPRGFIADWIVNLGPWAYLPIILIIFVETGLVIFPWLPGDSLLFTAGLFAADGGGLNLFILLPVCWVAAVVGDQCNYWIGREFGKRIMDSGKVKALTPERLAKTEGLIEKYGPLAVFLGRFFPFIRTFVPFIAGFGKMNYRRFIIFNIIGGITWSTLFILLGYFFGNIPVVQEHFELVVIGIIGISLIPTIAGLIKAKFSSKSAAEKAEDDTIEVAERNS